MCGAESSMIYIKPYDLKCDSAVSRQRQKEFHNGVIAHVRKSYEKFIESEESMREFNFMEDLLPVEPVKMPGPNEYLNEELKILLLKEQIRFGLHGHMTSSNEQGSSKNIVKSICEINDTNKNDRPVNLKRIREMIGLPLKLIEKVNTNNEFKRRMAPDAILRRQRINMRKSLPSFLDMVYLYFRSRRYNNSDFETLVKKLVENRGGASYFSALTSKATQIQLVREQLILLTDLLPEWCKISESKVKESSKLYWVDISDGIDIEGLRERLRKEYCI